MKIKKIFSLMACVWLVSSLELTFGVELDEKLKNWLSEKSEGHQLTPETKEIIIFIKDPRGQKDLSGMSFVQAFTSHRKSEEAYVQSVSRMLERSYKDLKSVDRLWASKAVVAPTSKSLLRQLKNDSRIEAIIENEKIYLGEPLKTKGRLTKKETRLTYGLELIKAPEAWSRGLEGENVVVGIIDSGIDHSHPDLEGKIILHQDFTKDGHTNDRNGHGTHVAGTIAGGNASGTQIGVAPKAKLMIAKVFDDRGSTSMATLLKAMEWMLNPDGDPSTSDAPRVVNNSWGANSQFILGFRNIVQTWRRFQIFPNFAAGNSGPRWMSTGAPARYPFSYAVGAVDESAKVTSFSSRGPSLWLRGWQTEESLPWYERWMPTLYKKPEISAPGHQVLSALPGGKYGRFSGTSMAAPHIAGVIALMLQANPQLSVDQIEEILNKTTHSLRGEGRNNATGHGLVQANHAVQAASLVSGQLTDRFVDADLSAWDWQTP
jgi:subtilisin family serine protease